MDAPKDSTDLSTQLGLLAAVTLAAVEAADAAHTLAASVPQVDAVLLDTCAALQEAAEAEATAVGQLLEMHAATAAGQEQFRAAAQKHTTILHTRLEAEARGPTGMESDNRHVR